MITSAMMDEIRLQHYGVLGMKWGVRKVSKTLTKTNIPNAKELKNYKGKAYFISEHDMDNQTLKPRVTSNWLTQNGYEDSTTPRISFAPTVDQCLSGLSQNVKDKTFYVHEPKDITKQKIFKPNTKAVPDSAITGELWATNDVTLKRVGIIKVLKDKGTPGMKFNFGNSSAELYEWEFKYLEEK